MVVRIEILFLCAAVVGAPEGPSGSQDKATAKKPAMGIPCRACMVAGQPTGKVDCDGCGGTKTSQIETGCQTCGGDGKHGACGQCQRGRTPCPARGYDGSIHDNVGRLKVKTGSRLEGSLAKRVVDITDYQRCPRCDGKRTLSCPHCDNGMKSCASCAGKGSGYFPCEKCKPPGAPRGKPTGKLPCPLCEGSKYVEPPSAPPPVEPALLPPPLSDGDEGLDLEGELEGHDDRLRKQEKKLEELASRLKDVDGGEPKPGEIALSKAGDKARELLRSCEARRADIRKHLDSARGLVTRAAPGTESSRAKQTLKECKDWLDDFDTDLKRFAPAIKSYKEDKAAADLKALRKDTARARQLEIDRAFAAATNQLVKVAVGSELPTPKTRLVKAKSAGDLTVEVTIVDPGSGAPEDPLPDRASETVLERLPEFLTGAFKSCTSLGLLTVVVKCPRLDELGHDELQEIDAYGTKRAEWEKLCTGKYSDDSEKQLTEIREPRYARRGAPSSEWGHIGLISLIAFFFVAVGVLVTARVMAR